MKASLTALKEIFPDDPSFAIEQFEAGATLVEAKAAYSDKLMAQNKTLQEKINEQAALQGAANFIGMAKSLASARGITLRAAMSTICRERPEVYRAYKASLRPGKE